MYASKLVFSQVIDHLPIHTFRRCVVRYQGNRYVKSFSCLDQYLCMAFAQLTYRESLRALEACLRAMYKMVILLEWTPLILSFSLITQHVQWMSNPEKEDGVHHNQCRIVH